MTACKKEDKPTADFTFTPDGLTVAFENFSKNADTYTWDFGDGSTATDENPSHTYAAEGTYTVSLTAKGDGGEDVYSEEIVVSKPAIKIDSDFEEWADYQAYYTDPAGTNGTLIESKVTSKNGFLFFYFRATAEAGPVIQVFIDKDNNGETGWGFWNKYETPGLDYLLEYVIEPFSGQYGPAEAGSTLYGATTEDWPWTITIAASDAVTESSGWVTKGNEKIIEFSVARSLMPDLGNTVRMAFTNATIDWTDAGTMPTGWQDPLLPLLGIEL
jgi:PKD repeat protein